MAYVPRGDISHRLLCSWQAPQTRCEECSIHLLEIFHPDRETLSDVGRAMNVRLDNDLTSPSRHGVAHCSEKAKFRQDTASPAPLTPGALATVTAQCHERLEVTGDVSMHTLCFASLSLVP